MYIRNNELNTRDVWQNIVGEKTNYAVLVGYYAGFAQLCGSAPIMHKIMRAHNCIIPLSLATVYNYSHCPSTVLVEISFEVFVCVCLSVFFYLCCILSS